MSDKGMGNLPGRRDERRDRVRAALDEIDATIRSTIDFDEILRRSLEGGVQTLHADAGVIELREHDNWVIRSQVGFSPDVIGLAAPPQKAPIGQRVADERAALYVEVVSQDFEKRIEFPRGMDVKSIVATPLVVQDEVIGVVVLYYLRESHQFDEADREFAARLGTLVSLSAQNARLFEAERHAARLADSLSKVNEILLSALTVNDVIARLVGEVSQTAGADKALLIEIDGDRYTITHVRNVRDDLVGVPKDASFFPGFALTARERHPILIEDTWNDPRTNNDFVVPHELRAFQLIPIVLENEVVGVLAFAFDAPRRFDADDVEFSERMSKAMSLSLKNARSYESEVEAREQARRELESTSLLLEVAGALAGPGDIDIKLETVAGLLLQTLEHDRVLIDLWDAERRELHVAAVAGKPPPAKRRYSVAELSPQAREAIDERKTVIVDYGRVPEAQRDAAGRMGFQLALLVPIVFGDQTLGVVASDQPQQQRQFSDREIEIIQGVASALGTALESSRLFEQLRDSESRFRALFETMSEGFLLSEVIPGDGESVDLLFLQVNPAFEQHTGLKAEDIVGRRMLEVFPQLEETGLGRLAHVFRTGKAVHFQARFGPLERWFEISAYLTEPSRLAIVFFDITERKTAEDAIARITERLDAHIDNSPLAVVEFDSQFRLTRWSDGAERIFGWSADETLGKALLEMPWVHKDDIELVEREFANLASGKTPGASTSIGTTEPTEASSGASGTTRPSTTLTATSCPFCRRSSTRLNARSPRRLSRRASRGSLAPKRSPTLAVGSSTWTQNVLTWSDEAYRIFGLEPQEFEASYEAFLDTVHPDDRAAVDEAYLGSIRDGRDSYEIEHRLVRRHTGEIRFVHEKSRHIRDEGGKIVRSVGMVLDITDRKRAEARLLEAQAETERERARLRQIIDELPIGVTLLDAKGAVLEVNAANERVWGGELPKATAPSGYGVYVARDHETGRRFEEDDWPIMRTLRTRKQASRIADIERRDGTTATVRFTTVPLRDETGELKGAIGLTEDISRQVETQRFDEAITKIGAAISASLDTDEILVHLLEECSMALYADSCGLTVKERNRWSVIERIGPKSSRSTSALADHQLAMSLLAANEEEPIVANDAQHDSRLDAQLMKELGIRSLLAIPIIVQDDVLGVLLFENRTEGKRFTVEEVEFSRKLMDIATLALQNALLYQRERAIAETLQNAILISPNDIQGVDVAYLYRPASTTANVGGDFYDLFELSDGLVGVVVGDVSGKGIEAARLTSLLRDGIRAYAYERRSPSWVLKRVNNLVHRSTRIGEFATVFFGVLDLRNNRLTYSSGGHPPAILSRGGTAVLLEGARSPIVGGFADIHFARASTTIGPGDRLVLYTDALTEARRDGEQFGEDRLLETTRALDHTPNAAVPQALLDEVRSYAGGDLKDDIVIMSIRRL